MNKHHHPSDDKPLGAPHNVDENAKRAFEIDDPSEHKQSAPAPKTWKTMPMWKKILVIWFSIVCAFGIYDTLFPSEKSLKLEELMPIMATPSPSTAPLSITPTVSPVPKN